MLKIKRKSLLYKSGVEYADFCLNHVEGCSHGCEFPCYAKQMAKRFGKVKKDSDWLNPKLVTNALELLDKEIPKYKDQIKFVHLCFMTDPFMYKYPEVSDMTLKIIEKLNKNKIKCTILTKGIHPKTLIDKEKYSIENEYGITLVSLNNKFKKEYEPHSAHYLARIRSLKFLHDNGLKTWVSIEPYPTPNLDTNQNLQELLSKIGFVDKIIFGKLNYNVVSSKFKENGSFYEECANQVIEFCEKNNIDYHIKFGTQKKYNGKTQDVFKKVCTPSLSIEA
ncbi:MAG: radical SAM protein [Nanoarchaeota archaeon]|nr:radical SAM protein [Nanoarchaeota archaeon]